LNRLAEAFRCFPRCFRHICGANYTTI
jgi:hypothetical protein